MTEKSSVSPDQEGDKSLVLVRITVHHTNGWPYGGDASVTLSAGEESINLERAAGGSLYEGLVQPGTYHLHVEEREGDFV